MDILRANARIDIEGDFRAWYCRVNTASNPADAASRMDPDAVKSLFPDVVQLHDIVTEELWDMVRSSPQKSQRVRDVFY